MVDAGCVPEPEVFNDVAFVAPEGGDECTEPGLLLIASAVFLTSLTMRTIDNAICDYLTIGTHFFWHLFNGLLLYLIIRGLVMNLPTQQTLEDTGRP